MKVCKYCGKKLNGRKRFWCSKNCEVYYRRWKKNGDMINAWIRQACSSHRCIKKNEIPLG